MKRLSVLSVVALALAIQVGTSHATITSITDEATWQSVAGSWSTAGFEGFLGPVSTQYAGVSFGDFNGGSPYATAFFPYEGQNSMFTVYPYNGGAGGWAATFSTPVQAFGFWSGDVQFSGSTISIRDSGNSLLGMYDLMGSGGGHGPYLYGFNVLSPTLSTSPEWRWQSTVVAAPFWTLSGSTISSTLRPLCLCQVQSGSSVPRSP